MVTWGWGRCNLAADLGNNVDWPLEDPDTSPLLT